jgi:rhodanese-related sulfurtransferase
MRTQTADPRDVQALRERGEPVEIIDVRTPAEFAGVHVDGAKCIPLDQLNARDVMAAFEGNGPRTLYLICKSGQRASIAAERFSAAGFSNVICIEGGTSAWEKAGLPVVRGACRVISLERQVRIAAGTLALIGVMLGWLVHPGFYGLCAFIGAGLIFAGVTDFCGMGMLLAKMPWNRHGGALRTAIG